MKVRKNIYIIASVFLCFRFFTTCKHGMGENIDVLPPELKITYPSPLDTVIIRDSFVLNGTATDDVSLASVTVSLRAKGSIAYSAGPFTAAVDKTTNTWSVELNKRNSNGEYPIKDAPYTFTVVATDKTGRTTTASADYTIDNTAPVVVMRTPGSANVLLPQTYGSELRITGDAVDTNIKDITFTAYDENQENPCAVTIPLESTALNDVLGVFGDADSFYNTLYGNEFSTIKTYYYEVQASDKAYLYKGGIPVSEGNISTVYYLYNDIAANIVDAETLHSINTGNYYTNVDGTLNGEKVAAADKIKEKLHTEIFGENYIPTIEVTTVNSTQSNILLSQQASTELRRLGVFELYPSTHPTFTLELDSAVNNIPFDNNITTEGSILEVVLYPNNDGVAINPETVTIRALQVKDGYKGSLTEVFNSDAFEAEYRLYPPVTADGSDYDIPTAENGRYTYSLKQEGVKSTIISRPHALNDDPKTDGTVVSLPDGTYIIDVTGLDVSDPAEIEGVLVGDFNNGGVYYGFRKTSNSVPPNLEVTKIDSKEPTSTTVYMSNKNLNTDSVTDEDVITSIEGTVIASFDSELDTIKTVTYKVGNQDAKNATFESSDKKNYTWNFELTHAHFGSPLENNSAIYDLIITATDSRGASKSVNYNLYYDVEKPTFTSLTHSVSKVDGSETDRLITVKGMSTDNDRLASVSYTMKLNSADGILIKSSTGTISSPANFTIPLKLSELATDGIISEDYTVEIAVTVTDRTGLFTTQTMVFDNEKPTVSNGLITQPATWIDSSKNWYNTGELTLSVMASDVEPSNVNASGIKMVEWTIDDPEDAGAKWNFMTNSEDTEVWTGTCILTDSGDYSISFRATDNSLNVGTSKNALATYMDFDAPNSMDIKQIDDVDASESTNKFSNAQNDIRVTFENITDMTNGSGAKTVQLLKIGEHKFALDENETDVQTSTVNEDGTAEIVITKEQIAAAGQSGFVVFRVTDMVGNYADFSLFSMTIDNTAPTVTITNPSNDNLEVNKTITIEGTAFDVNNVNSVQLQYKNSADEWENIGTKITEETISRWSLDIDTTTFTDNATVTLRAQATDTGGNVGNSEERTITVNQDSDRPVVTVQNVNLEAMQTSDINDKVWLVSMGGSAILKGTVHDDDGAISESNFSIFVDGTKQESTVTYENGVWGLDLSQKGGERKITFEVIDEEREIFKSLALDTTETTVQSSVKITDGTCKFGYNDSTVKGSTIELTVDTSIPEIGTIYYDKTPGAGESTTWFNDDSAERLGDNTYIGGTGSVIALKFTATDDNGIKDVKIFNDETDICSATKVGDGDDFVAKIDTKDTHFEQNAFAMLRIVAYDNVGGETTKEIPIFIDNVAPTIEVISHKNYEQVTGTVRVSGRASRGETGSSLPTENAVQFQIPTKVGNDWTLNENNWESVTAGTTSWKIDFDDGLTTESKELLEAYKENSGIETEKDSNLWKISIVFRVQDSVGNVATTAIDDFILVLDPDGDRPKVEIVSPVPEVAGNAVVLGGIVRIFGSAEDNEAISAVYMQIDDDGNGFDDETEFLVTGTNSWNTTINEDGKYNPANDGDIKYIAFRVRAEDNNGKSSSWSQSIELGIDKTAPRIGSSEALKLVQYVGGYDSGTVVAEKTYVDDMWLTGTWYLTGSIEDEGDISSITVLDGDTEIANTEAWFEKEDVDFEGDNKGYRMNIPLSSNSGGNLSYKIKVTDNTTPTGRTTSREISVNIDNSNPSIDADLLSNEVTIGDGKNGTTTVEQSNDTFTFGSTVAETGSGLSHVAFWFERPSHDEKKDRVYNVMEKNTEIALVKNPENGDVGLIEEIPQLNLSYVTRSSETSLTDSFIADNVNVRKGGLVRIGGVDRFITDVTDDTITFTPGVSTSYTTATIPYVMVVNNLKYESKVGSEIANDDGDGMVESVEGSNGQGYIWSASIDSRNIPDGPITINYIAYDKSGLASEIKSVSTRIENNRPAIAKVLLKTDLNGSGEIDINDGVIEYSTLVSGKATSSATVDARGENGSVKFTAKGLTHVIPEIVGGNGDLYYSLTTTGHSGIDTADSTKIRTDNGENNASATSPIVLTDDENDKLLGLEDTDGTARTFNISIWDSTSETTIGTDSQRATLELKMHVDSVDDTAPETTIMPFYWTGETENSLYENSRENGHIELPTSDSEKPQVSGKITFEGTITDDKVIREIRASITDCKEEEVTLATYNEGTWTIAEIADSIENDGWQFEVDTETETFGQNGHEISWKLHWDSEKLTNVAGKEKKFIIVAKDAKANATSANNTYTVDVVPYITSVQTVLSDHDSGTQDTASRTALGRYPVYEGEKITFTGFNIPNEKKTRTIGSTMSSGPLSVTVNNVKSINNSNTNENEYNITTIANNVLTDDVYVDIWTTTMLDNIDDQVGKYYSPEMRIRPNDGTMGFSYTSDDDYYYMAAKYGNTYKNNMKIERGYTIFYESALAFDVDGNSYGFSTNTDTFDGDYYGSQAFFSDYSTFYFDKVGNDLSNPMSSYLGGNYRRRIMSTTVESTGSYEVADNRAKSPVIATTNASVDRTDTNPTGVYLAYYDDLQKEIRYHWGTVGSTLELVMNKDKDGKTLKSASLHGFNVGDEVSLQKNSSNDSYNPDYNKRYYVIAVSVNTIKLSDTKNGTIVSLDWENSFKVSAVGGQLKDISGGYMADQKPDSIISDTTIENYSIIAGSTAQSYLSLDARAGITGLSGDLVVMTFTDGNELKYAYNTAPRTDNDTAGAGWTIKTVDTASSMYSAIKIDGDGGIHIAYADEEQNLKYMYLSRYDESVTADSAVVVDSYDSVGTHLRLDVAKNEIGGSYIPYISYYSTTQSRAKLAYRVSDTVLSGVADNRYNGNWEVTHIPSANSPTEDTINVGVHRGTDGVIATIADMAGQDYANGSATPAIAYATSNRNGLEIAQKKVGGN